VTKDGAKDLLTQDTEVAERAVNEKDREESSWV